MKCHVMKCHLFVHKNLIEKSNSSAQNFQFQESKEMMLAKADFRNWIDLQGSISVKSINIKQDSTSDDLFFRPSSFVALKRKIA